MALCPIHGVEFKQIPAGVSKSTGKAYNAFWACPERGCREKPPGQQWQAAKAKFATVVGGYVAPGSVSTVYRAETKPNWEAIRAQKNDIISLHVAFKAAVELCAADKLSIDTIEHQTLLFHDWLLKQQQPSKPAAQGDPDGEDSGLDDLANSIPF